MLNPKRLMIVFAILFAVTVSACFDPASKVNSYVALVPNILRPGEHETVSLTLFHGDKLATGTVEVALLQDGREVLKQAAEIDGKGAIDFQVPLLPQGEYEMEVRGEGFFDRTKVRVEEGTLLFLETDKPIYKPGQTIHAGHITRLRAEAGVTEATVEVLDAKGIKVFKQDVQTDEYGMATLDLPLSTEPNLGVWKVTAKAGKRSAQLDVRVEEYVLPKYEVKVDLPKEWVLASDPINGKVERRVQLRQAGAGRAGDQGHPLRRHVAGVRQRHRPRSTARRDFELPAVELRHRRARGGGMGNVHWRSRCAEKATGYEEKTTRLLTVAAVAGQRPAHPRERHLQAGAALHLPGRHRDPGQQAGGRRRRALNITYLGEGLPDGRARRPRRSRRSSGQGTAGDHPARATPSPSR